jgi:hypothetical protein
MVIEDVGNWFCNQTTGWLKIIKVNHDLVKKNVRNLMLPQWLCGHERLNASSDQSRILPKV